jgi:hypothetical protein
LERPERLNRQERRNFLVGEIPDDILADIEAAEYGKAAE